MNEGRSCRSWCRSRSDGSARRLGESWDGSSTLRDEIAASIHLHTLINIIDAYCHRAFRLPSRGRRLRRFSRLRRLWRLAPTRSRLTVSGKDRVECKEQAGQECQLCRDHFESLFFEITNVGRANVGFDIGLKPGDLGFFISSARLLELRAQSFNPIESLHQALQIQLHRMTWPVAFWRCRTAFFTETLCKFLKAEMHHAGDLYIMMRLAMNLEVSRAQYLSVSWRRKSRIYSSFIHWQSVSLAKPAVDRCGRVVLHG